MPDNLLQRISPADMADYMSHRISSRALAVKYGASYDYLRHVMPKRPPKPVQPTKKDLRNARNEFRVRLINLVETGQISMKEAINQAHCCERTMYRLLAKVRSEGAKNA